MGALGDPDGASTARCAGSLLVLALLLRAFSTPPPSVLDTSPEVYVFLNP
jgi:hypothetical protein